METEKRTVINKSSKKKCSSPLNNKANAFTEMVVYRTKNNKGKMTSITKHEVRKNF